MLLDPKDFARASCACKTLKSLCYNDVSFWAHAIHPGARNAIVSLNQIGANVVSPDTEIKALRCCMSLAALALGNFQTTLEEDKRILLKECSPSVNAQATKTKQQVLAIRVVAYIRVHIFIITSSTLVLSARATNPSVLQFREL